MLYPFKLLFGVFVDFFRARRDLILENLALRQLLCVFSLNAGASLVGLSYISCNRTFDLLLQMTSSFGLNFGFDQGAEASKWVFLCAF